MRSRIPTETHHCGGPRAAAAFRTMNSKMLVLPAALVLGSLFLAGSDAQTAPEQKNGLGYPYERPCVVTLDPRAAGEFEAGSNVTGLNAPVTARGDLIYLSAEWCVLREGSYENWIPRDKVLMLRASK